MSANCHVSEENVEEHVTYIKKILSNYPVYS